MEKVCKINAIMDGRTLMSVKGSSKTLVLPEPLDAPEDSVVILDLKKVKPSLGGGYVYATAYKVKEIIEGALGECSPDEAL